MSISKTFTLLFVASTLVAGGLTASAAGGRAKAFSKKSVEKIDRKKAARAQARAAAVKNLPTKEAFYLWDEEAQEWVHLYNTEFSYTPSGKIAVTTEIDVESDGESQVRITNTYNDADALVSVVTATSEDAGETWENSQKTEYTYDAVVPSFALSNLIYYWTDDAWELGYGNQYDITRNDKGVVTSVSRMAPYEGKMDPIAKVENTLSADGATVSALKVTELKEDWTTGDIAWEENFDLRDIVWNNTDGQTLRFDIEDYARGANRVKSAESWYGGEKEASITGAYPNAFEGEMTFSFTDGSEMIIGTRYTDEATGSYEDYSDLTFFEGPDDDLNGDGIINNDDRMIVNENEVIAVKYDQFGNVVSEEQTLLIDGEIEEAYGTKWTYTYNEDNVVTEVVVTVFDPDSNEYYNDQRMVLSDFIAAGDSGVGNVGAAAGDISYTLRGRTLTVIAAGAAKVAVTALDGKLVASAEGEGVCTLDLSALAAGVYVISVKTASGAKVIKAVL